jgi:3-methyladenine DNA glycosylase AlkD
VPSAESARWRAAELAARIEEALQAAAVAERAAREKRYLKSDLVHYGVTVPATRSAVRAVLRAAWPDGAVPPREAVLELADLLWSQPPDAPVHERRMAAVEVLGAGVDWLTPRDLAAVEGYLRQARTWALVDGLAVSVAGVLVRTAVDRGPAARSAVLATLDRWAADEDVWIRRSALLAFLPLLRAGGDPARFLGHADAMLDEREFFVRKAIGWVLRELARRRPEVVASWLLPRARRASGVTWREAVKPLGPDVRALLEEARRAL